MKVERATASLTLTGPTGRLAVVADTHSAPNERGLQHLRALKPDAILHGGDIGSADVLRTLERIAPLYAVRGNIDTRLPDVPDELTLTVTHAGKALTLLLLHIAVTGPRLRADVLRRAKAQAARLVVCGHSHVPFIGQQDGVTVFNPGSIGPRRFTLPILFGALEFGPKGLALRHVDAHSGADLLPPA